MFYASEYDENGRSIMDWNKIPVDRWFNTSNHSSCWRSDGFRELHKHDFEAYEIAHENVPEEVRPCYNHSHKHNRLGHGICAHKLVKFVEVNHSAVDPSDSYHRKIDSIKELKVKMVIIDEENGK